MIVMNGMSDDVECKATIVKGSADLGLRPAGVQRTSTHPLRDGRQPLGTAVGRPWVLHVWNPDDLHLELGTRNPEAGAAAAARPTSGRSRSLSRSRSRSRSRLRQNNIFLVVLLSCRAARAMTKAARAVARLEVAARLLASREGVRVPALPSESGSDAESFGDESRG